MKTTQPVLFVSHGAPSLLIDQDPTTKFFESLGNQLPKPEAIVSVSAHWETVSSMVTGNAQPETIHDFYGFQDELYEIVYPCPGSETLAENIKNNLVDFSCQIDPERGLDHGTWVPLKLMFPESDVPVIQLSLQTHKGPQYHYELGQDLKSLSEENILLICSGSAAHNIRGFGRHTIDAPPQDYVLEFDQWLSDVIHQNDIDSLINYRTVAPYGEKNHPTEEHLLPLFVALGAAREGMTGKQIHQGYTYSILSMAAYQWG